MKLAYPYWITFFLWAVIYLFGCAASPGLDLPIGYEMAAPNTLSDEAASERNDMRETPSPRSSSGAGISLDLKQPPQENREQARKIHYDGSIKLLTTHPQKVLESAIELANTAGGYIQSLSDTKVVLQIPVKEFHSVFYAILKLGDVIDRSISAKDITDAYFSAELRLKIAKNTRKRLLSLLQKAKNEKEKIKLLKEIERITRQIEILQNQMNALKTLADYSTLTLEVTPRKAFSEFMRSDDHKGFNWINQLSPFKRIVAMSGNKIRFHTPDGLVVLENERIWISESADGVVFWGSQRLNEPFGDTEFWKKSVQQRLGPEFNSITLLALKSFQLLRMVSKTSLPYVYYVGINSDAEKLTVVEVYFPSVEHENRYKQSILNAIEMELL